MQSVRRLLYSMKNRYGSPMDLYREIDGEPDILTGRTITNRMKYHVNKGIIIKQRMGELENFLAKANIPNSGLIEINDTTILIDGKDLPRNFVPELGDYIVTNKDRYDINFIRSLNDNEAYYIGLKEFKGSEIPQIHDIHIHDKLTLIQIVK